MLKLLFVLSCCYFLSLLCVRSVFLFNWIVSHSIHCARGLYIDCFENDVCETPSTQGVYSMNTLSRIRRICHSGSASASFSVRSNLGRRCVVATKTAAAASGSGRRSGCLCLWVATVCLSQDCERRNDPNTQFERWWHIFTHDESWASWCQK